MQQNQLFLVSNLFFKQDEWLFHAIPLKSMEEIIDFLEPSEEFLLAAKNYRENNLCPVDSLGSLAGLSFDVVLYFEEGDRVLSNRDDQLYRQQLQQGNSKGVVTTIIGKEGGHSVIHPSLWQVYLEGTVPRRNIANGMRKRNVKSIGNCVSIPNF